MSKRKDRNLIEFGNVIRAHRDNLTLKNNSRSFFIDDRIKKGLLNYNEISEKTLMNIENGYNLPSLSTLKILAVALEVDFFKLLKDLYEHIPIE
ncbi:helix-turn-helix domain-containing protein [Staphylococcus agnetis]|uniref:helix-turn-helix domain-containing protein n=1 Tax=Staphylococcus agnetis TaxID=985762 RepID=UPI0004E35713|nr:helix-turn-helix transcriptional regulator [Staphylococcus agnetis]KFE42137.1 hypothetical protein SAGN_04905 [Staphylococcus agnetis]